MKNLEEHENIIENLKIKYKRREIEDEKIVKVDKIKQGKTDLIKNKEDERKEILFKTKTEEYEDEMMEEVDKYNNDLLEEKDIEELIIERKVLRIFEISLRKAKIEVNRK